ncbi:MAG: type II toxin-antitoxin system VapC family toxin [Victivallales bacterium]|jgi:predicted nucleic acid-binding protein
MKEKVYIETSVVSYLCSRQSRDLIVAANQEVTQEWWRDERRRYDLFVSEFVLSEIAAGDKDAALKRQEAIQGIAILIVNEASERLAVEIMRQAKLPGSVADDVAHVSVASVQGMEYLLTWNCAHIANPHWLGKLSRIITACGYSMPAVCTPQALLEGKRS